MSNEKEPNIAELERLLEAATPGPWIFQDGRSREGDSIEKLVAEIGKAGPDEEPEYGQVLCENDGHPDSQIAANWTLIAALRNAADALIAAWEQCEGYKRLARNMEECVDNVREAMGLETTHWQVLPGDVEVMRKERDALLEDKARLDWWEKNLPVHHTRSSGGTVVLCVGDSETIIGSGFDLRSAIDDARKERP